jgi:aspartyl-tRNA(Asn)/glutamyl-tRNA(Gln) amidotransferase subunit A
MTTVGDDIAALDALALSEDYASGAVSPVEAITAALARIDQLDPAINAFRLVDPDRACEEALRSRARWSRGEARGPLDGVPVAIKDVFLTRGWPTLRGSLTIDPEQPWDSDAPAVAALRRHGAIAVGKTCTPELGWKGVTDSRLDGITRNPWDLDRTAGGSSGGSAAALAAGMVALALGTDGGGSIRIPCAFCGLPGIKPTFARVPAWPASPFGVLSHAGPMARTVGDLAVLLDVLCEPDPRDWGALEGPARSFRDGLDGGVGDLRVALSLDFGYVDVEPEVSALVQRAAERLAALGAHVEAVDPGFEDPRGTFDAMWSAGAARAVADLGARDELLDPGLLRIVETGRGLSALDYLAAWRGRDELGLRMSELHEDWDVLITPTVPIAAFEAGRDAPADSSDPEWPSWTPFTYPFNLTQQPAGTIPCGFTSAGLPVGLQIVAPRYADYLVLRVMRAYELADPQPTVAIDATRSMPK